MIGLGRPYCLVNTWLMIGLGRPYCLVNTWLMIGLGRPYCLVNTWLKGIISTSVDLLNVFFQSPSCIHFESFWQYLFPGYVIEKRDTRTNDWVRCNTQPVEKSKYNVMNLTEGREYEFRVAACNEAGPGRFSKATEPHIARDPICKCPCCICLCYFRN
jgi:hypothetical protein